ncbi:MAG TPA: CDP-alcohol phosphatidyltransferase family protein [Anaerolineales bacterium]|nr:CDP-alcohol phosphatidyltransferase family protein [Anaerolineales bacterium]
MLDKLPVSVRRILANGVHLFTASGAVWGFLTLLAIWDENYKLAIIYMVVAMFVDGFDGILARWFDVKSYARGVDGGLMDNIIDYLNYVVVASLLLVKVDGLMPNGLAMPAAMAILLTSAYQFSQTDAKTDDQSYFFKGFPSVWNFLVVYMMLLGLNPWINFALLVICNILVFVPVKYLYPTRNSRFRRFTLGLTYLYGALGVWGLMQYPHVPEWVVSASFVYVVFYGAMSFFPRLGEPESA